MGRWDRFNRVESSPSGTGALQNSNLGMEFVEEVDDGLPEQRFLNWIEDVCVSHYVEHACGSHTTKQSAKLSANGRPAHRVAHQGVATRAPCRGPLKFDVAGRA